MSRSIRLNWFAAPSRFYSLSGFLLPWLWLTAIGFAVAVDEKYSIPEKENAWILASGNHPIWIVGKRIDDRVKITSKTKKILRIKWLIVSDKL